MSSNGEAGRNPAGRGYGISGNRTSQALSTFASTRRARTPTRRAIWLTSPRTDATTIVGFDEPENPQILKNLIRATGATCLDYMDETECCGAPSASVSDRVALQLARDKLNHVKMAEAQALITICPFCHIMFDTNELRIERMFGETYGITVLHYPQLLGLAMNMAHEEIAFNELRVDTSRVLQVIRGEK